jgi:glycerol uptake facilitator-like aquaporin
MVTATLIAAVSFVVHYWTDKCWLLRTHGCPPPQGYALGKSVIRNFDRHIFTYILGTILFDVIANDHYAHSNTFFALLIGLWLILDIGAIANGLTKKFLVQKRYKMHHLSR